MAEVGASLTTQQDPWRRAWQAAGSSALLLGLLAALLILLCAWIALPQAPPQGTESFARWFSAASARFGPATELLYRAGLLQVTQSAALRLLLAVLAVVLSVRLVDSVDALRSKQPLLPPPASWVVLAVPDLDTVLEALRHRHFRVQEIDPPGSVWLAWRWRRGRVAAVLFYSGTLLLLLGLLVGALWGWRADGLTGRVGEAVHLPNSGFDFTVGGASETVAITTPAGVRAIVQGQGPGLRVSAADAEGRPVDLIRTADSHPSPVLTVTLTQDQSEGYFAVPALRWVVRVSLEPDAALDAETPLQVQIYRSLSGALVEERVVTGDTQIVRPEGALTLASAPYARFALVCDPGRALKILGAGLALSGLLGLLIWPVREVWIRLSGTSLEAAGAVPAAWRSNLQVEEVSA